MSIKIDKSLIISKLKSHYGFNSDTEFASFLGIKPQTMSSWHSRNTFDIDLLYAKCVNVNGDFLLSGKGEIEKTKNKENLTDSNGKENGKENGKKRNVQKNLTKENDNINDNLFANKPNVKNRLAIVADANSEYGNIMRKIKFADNVNLSENGAPYYPLPISAGQTMELLKEEERPTGFISIPGLNCKAFFPVIGCSYEPLIRAGDIIGIDFINKWEVLDPDCLYYIITHDQRMLKRLMRHPTIEDKLLCISPNYKEFSIDMSEIKTVHKVVFYGRLV